MYNSADKELKLEQRQCAERDTQSKVQDYQFEKMFEKMISQPSLNQTCRTGGNSRFNSFFYKLTKKKKKG